MLRGLPADAGLRALHLLACVPECVPVVWDPIQRDFPSSPGGLWSDAAPQPATATQSAATWSTTAWAAATQSAATQSAATT